jgi:hypothetical protein
MKTFELRHTPDGGMLCRLMDDGWEILRDALGNGAYNARGEGGWWLYKGDESLARAEQQKRWVVIKQDIDAYYAQPWV